MSHAPDAVVPVERQGLATGRGVGSDDGLPP